MFLMPLAPTRRTALFDHWLQEPRVPALDVAESDDQYTVTLDVPGVAKDEVKVAIDGRRVTISTATQANDTVASDAATTRLVHRERSALRATWTRSLTLATPVDERASSAKLEHGVLTLSLIKVKPVAPPTTHLTIN